MTYVYLADSFVDGLSKVFQTVFTEVLTPVLRELLEFYIDYYTKIIWNMFSGFLILILSLVCSLIDFFENIFNVFAGIAPVSVEGQSSPMYLIDALFQMEYISKAFMYITFMSVIVCFIFTIYKTVKSISDMALEDKNPVSKVLREGLKATITFMMIPLLCIFMLRLSAVVTSNINNAFAIAQGGQSATIGTVLFLSVSMDADVETTKPKDLISGEIDFIVEDRTPSLTDKTRIQYMTGKRDYRNMEHVKEDFHVQNFNFIAGFACSIVMLLVLAGSVLVFVRKIFELLLLYIVSPLFVSTIPLDDGATFAKWRELFVAKFFSGFGSIFVMKLYLMLVPVITSSRLILYEKTLPYGNEINMILQLFLIVGGAWAVYKGQSLIMEIFSYQAGLAEKQAGSLIVGMIVGGAQAATSVAAAAATGGASAAMQGASMTASGASMAASGVGGTLGGSGNSDQGQAYRG